MAVKSLALIGKSPREPGIRAGGGDLRPLSARELRVLAVLERRPFGSPSIADVARAADLPATTTGRILRRLQGIDLVRLERRPSERGGAKGRGNWVLTTLPEVMPSLSAIRTPERTQAEDRQVPPPRTVPHDFWHHFRNSNPRELALPGDAHLVADRLMRSRDAAAFGWALDNLPVGSLVKYGQSTEFDVRTRSIIRESLRARTRAGHSI